MDHMQSTKPGFHGQAKGALTSTCFHNAAIFANHFSQVKFVYFMTTNLTSKETVKAKQAFEQFAVFNYHCDNGRFADTLFHKACKSQREKLTFCGFNAHCQKSAQKQLLHTRQCWPQVVGTALWPYALCHAAYLSNVLSMCKDGQSRLKLFSGIKVGSNKQFLHTFGCPMFPLHNSLASNNSLPRWDPRACIGLNLGPSPTHACNVHLVLSLTTGLVSPQLF